MPAPYYADKSVTLYHGDCRDILPSLRWDAVVSDPPYGSGLSTAFHERFTHKAGDWWKNTNRETVTRHAPIRGDDKPFDPSHLLSDRPTVLWGGNWYGDKLPSMGGWLVWDKRRGIEEAEWPMSEAELAWTNIGNRVRFFRHRWFGLIRDSERGQHFHPTQKPVALMAFCIEHTKSVGVVLDPYCGSGPTLVAAKNLGRRAIGIEIEERYCAIAAERLSQEVLFAEGA